MFRRSLVRFGSTMTLLTETVIRAALSDSLKPVHLEVLNESYMHNVPKGSETHFKVLVVSQEFENMPLIKRHRLVNDVVKQALADINRDFVHALSIEAKSPQQWDPSYKVESSPNCRGGFGSVQIKIKTCTKQLAIS